MNHRMAGMYIATLFLARDVAHVAHLRAQGPGSYAQHSALGDFYDGIVGLADSFAEAYQGEYEILLTIPLLDNEYSGDIASVLRQMKEWIQKNKAQIAPREQTALHNIVDEAVALFQSTLYKLNFLE